MKSLIRFLCILVIPSAGYTQILEDADFEHIIEEILPQQEYDVDYNDLYDRLFSMYSSPLNLNTATHADFQSLYFLNDEQISGIIEYRKKYGNFLTFFELNTIEGLDRQTIERIQKFAKIETTEDERWATAIRNPSVNELMLRYQTILEEKRGYIPTDSSDSGTLTSRYAGDPGRIFARYLLAKPGRYSIGFTTEKDPGEKIIWDPATRRYGMDYYSFHAMLENVAIFDRIIAGDFSLDFGQGLIFGSGIRIGKGAEPVSTIRKNERGLRPYRSAYESKDFSGLAASCSIGQSNFTLFYSNVRRDARILQHENELFEDFTYISSISTVGLHRTPTEIAAKHNLTDRSFGGNMNMSFLNKKLIVGLNSIFTQYNRAIIPGSERYRLYQFRGNSNNINSFYVNYYFKKGHIFTEWARSQSGGMARSTGVVMNLASFIQTSLHFRNYDSNYHSFLGNAFGENSVIGNERGIFWGMLVKPTEKLHLSAYFDYFKFPWLKYRVDAPSDGMDFMASMNYNISEQASVRLRFRDKIKSMNYTSGTTQFADIQTIRTSRLMFDFNYQLNSFFRMRSWIQTTDISFYNDRHQGFLVAQDLAYSSKKLTLSGRFALFDANDYDSRIYIYEPDLLYVYNVPSFYNQGIRYYILCKYVLSKHITIWGKYAQTKYFNIETIGTGTEEINGNTRSNLSFQMKINF